MPAKPKDRGHRFGFKGSCFIFMGFQDCFIVLSLKLPCHKPHPGTFRQDDLTPSLDRAIKVYAAEHGMELSEATPAMVKGSQEGLLFWASKGLDCSARGAAGQALNRALDKNPTVKHDIYKWLGGRFKTQIPPQLVCRREASRKSASNGQGH